MYQEINTKDGGEFVMWDVNCDREGNSSCRGANMPDGEGLVISADTMGFQLAAGEKRL